MRIGSARRRRRSNIGPCSSAAERLFRPPPRMATAEALRLRPEAELARDDSVAESAAAPAAEDPTDTSTPPPRMGTAEALRLRPESELARDDSVAESAAAARAEELRITASSFEWLVIAM